MSSSTEGLTENESLYKLSLLALENICIRKIISMESYRKIRRKDVVSGSK
jgi:hypothetical protein